jgi:protein tyrosine phosphatase (PTP) superfamily phosphohydrolase (DUF442 family)
MSARRIQSLWTPGLLLAVLVTAAACTDGSKPAASSMRNVRWAAPVTGQPGLPNLFKVNDHLYRGAQPEAAGYATLKKLGIKTVINLRAFHEDQKECQAAGLANIAIPLYTWDVEHDEIGQFLQAVNNPQNWPIFVHCEHGADRTGLMCASYRMVIEGWNKDDAIQEMTEGDFGYHEIWSNLIKLLDRLDVPGMKAKLAVARPTPF